MHFSRWYKIESEISYPPALIYKTSYSFNSNLDLNTCHCWIDDLRKTLPPCLKTLFSFCFHNIAYSIYLFIFAF